MTSLPYTGLSPARRRRLVAEDGDPPGSRTDCSVSPGARAGVLAPGEANDLLGQAIRQTLSAVASAYLTHDRPTPRV